MLSLHASLAALAIFFGLLGSLLTIYDGVCWANHDASLGHTEPIFNPPVPRLFLFDVAFSLSGFQSETGLPVLPPALTFTAPRLLLFLHALLR